MTNPLRIGILGCGDFFRGQSRQMKNNDQLIVASLFDPDTERAKQYAEELGGTVAESADAILDDPNIDLVCLFVPPWIRVDLVEKAAATGKHIITTKPLGADSETCTRMCNAVEKAGVTCGVLYSRSGDAFAEALKNLFEGGEYGQLALYKQDWIHHYPQWNDWATDPVKNGGPFMDAMIHNMNLASYLMGRPATTCTYFSDTHVHDDIACRDTESMKLDFEGNGSAHLFITWAADLAVHSTNGNDREHIDQCFMVTDQGWHVTTSWEDGAHIRLSRRGEVVTVPVETGTLAHIYDETIAYINGTAPWPRRLVPVQEAANDIILLRTVEQHIGERVTV